MAEDKNIGKEESVGILCSCSQHTRPHRFVDVFFFFSGILLSLVWKGKKKYDYFQLRVSEFFSCLGVHFSSSERGVGWLMVGRRTHATEANQKVQCFNFLFFASERFFCVLQIVWRVQLLGTL